MTKKTQDRSKKTTKERIDQMLVDRGLAESRTRAQSLVMSGLVLVDGHRVDKPGTRVALDQTIVLKGQDHPWVSRGGLKLDKGLKVFNIAVTGSTALDVGASTGGFSDVLLTRGASRVYAVDVGYGQLAHRLRTDPRVVVLERTNARYLTTDHIPEPVDLVVCDASFIGLRTVLETPLTFLKPGGYLVALIKPQFEVGKERLGKGGVVRDPALHQEVCDTMHTWLTAQPGWTVLGITESPIRGPEGNVEFLLGAQRLPT
ncbi:TlyA family RNA methyltransferase [Haematospirillum jordaniae]|uniref:TlyA family RNA methyltransferase n=1 Tax=Haematospirillum jordaniae TaxID=1549855 RepID=UPI001432FB38|nr:TlyA family RNA methyltransferase [Haematospirillum jordaniae]NKD45738.1 TlyA family RNA methyltransferase [Haematospirillum jordaniae]NKD92940.1 TlyA family RNA methyltransferase [Haematospirillum jordaniae]